MKQLTAKNLANTLLLVMSYFLPLTAIAQSFPGVEINTTQGCQSPIINGNNNSVTIRQEKQPTVCVGGVSGQYQFNSKSNEKKTRPQRKLMVTEAYLLPNDIFFKEYLAPNSNHLKNIAFLFADIKNLSDNPILITSVDFKIEGAKNVTKQGGLVGLNIPGTTPSKVSVPVNPGEIKKINFSAGILLRGLSDHMKDLNFRDEILFEELSPPRTGNDILVEKFNHLLGNLYGKNASLLLSFYENDEKLVHQIRVYLPDGSDHFFSPEKYEATKTASVKNTNSTSEYTKKLAHDAFLGTYMTLLNKYGDLSK